MTLFLGILIGIFLPTLYFKVRVFLETRKIKKLITPQLAEEDKLCKAPHTWMPTSIITREGSKKTQVCRVCGLLSGTGRIASPEAIDKMEENNRVAEIEEKIYSEFLDKEDDQIKQFFEKEITSGVDFNKLAAVHSAGMTFTTRYSMYRMSKAEDIQKELTRANA